MTHFCPDNGVPSSFHNIPVFDVFVAAVLRSAAAEAGEDVVAAVFGQLLDRLRRTISNLRDHLGRKLLYQTKAGGVSFKRSYTPNTKFETFGCPTTLSLEVRLAMEYLMGKWCAVVVESLSDLILAAAAAIEMGGNDVAAAVVIASGGVSVGVGGWCDGGGGGGAG